MIAIKHLEYEISISKTNSDLLNNDFSGYKLTCEIKDLQKYFEYLEKKRDDSILPRKENELKEQIKNKWYLIDAPALIRLYLFDKIGNHYSSEILTKHQKIDNDAIWVRFDSELDICGFEYDSDIFEADWFNLELDYPGYPSKKFTLDSLFMESEKIKNKKIKLRSLSRYIKHRNWIIDLHDVEKEKYTLEIDQTFHLLNHKIIDLKGEIFGYSASIDLIDFMSKVTNNRPVNEALKSNKYIFLNPLNFNVLDEKWFKKGDIVVRVTLTDKYLHVEQEAVEIDYNKLIFEEIDSITIKNGYKDQNILASYSSYYSAFRNSQKKGILF